MEFCVVYLFWSPSSIRTSYNGKHILCMGSTNDSDFPRGHPPPGPMELKTGDFLEQTLFFMGECILFPLYPFGRRWLAL